MSPEDFISQASRFWSKVDRSGECWLWTGEKNNMGYGRFEFWHEGRRLRYFAHRLACVLTGHPIPETRVARHSCDTPACIRPDHIIPGSQGDNIRDAVDRGRMNLTGLSAEYEKTCLECGAAFKGRPQRRYCDAHSGYVQARRRQTTGSAA